MKKQTSINLIKLLDKDDTLKSELTQLQEFNYCLEHNLDFEDF